MNRHLYAPWRTEYFSDQKIDACVFCNIVKKTQNDKDLGVLFRSKDFFIVMNRYPYSPGHFMIIPNMHTDKLEELSDSVWLEMNIKAKKGVELLKDILDAQGVNIGINLGKAAGAGIEEHIHLHVVPRWFVDCNFITTIGNTRVYGTDFDDIYNKLKNKAEEYFNS